jgi:hypothetical protein
MLQLFLITFIGFCMIQVSRNLFSWTFKSEIERESDYAGDLKILAGIVAASSYFLCPEGEFFIIFAGAGIGFTLSVYAHSRLNKMAALVRREEARRIFAFIQCTNQELANQIEEHLANFVCNTDDNPTE